MSSESTHNCSDKSSHDEQGHESYDQDELQSFLLRAELDEMEFSVVWRSMKALGWKHKSSRYITPDGIDLGSSKDAMKRLDVYALPRLSFRNNQHNRGRRDEGDNLGEQCDEMVLKLKEVRKTLLVSIFSNLDSMSRQFDSVDGNEDYDHTTVPDNSTTQRKKGSHKQTTNKSATVNEPGTEQYFGNQPFRRTTRNRQAKKQESSNKIEYDSIEFSQGNGDALDMKNARQRITWPKPKDNVEAMKNMVEKGNDIGKENRSLVAEVLQQNSSQWEFLLSTNHSLLFHGFGSKRKLLNDFASKLKSCGDVLTLDGNDPEMSFSKLLDIIAALFLNGVEPQNPSRPRSGMKRKFNLADPVDNSDVVQRARLISQTLGAKRSKPLYVLIHNIDGTSLRNQDFQNALAALLVNSNIVDDSHSNEQNTTFQNERSVRLAATVDHVDASVFLWNVDLLDKFSWIWKQVDTFYPYFEEVEVAIHDETRKIKAFTRKDVVDFTFMEKVLRSLAPRHGEIFKILAELQISTIGSGACNVGKKDSFIDYKDWWEACSKKMAVSKETEFKSLKKELIDHKMIESMEDKSVGKEYIRIPTTVAKIQELLKQM